MPGRLFLTRPTEEIAALVRADRSGVPDEPPRLNIQPGQNILTLVPGPRLRAMRWGLIPVGRTNARGRPVMETIVNARSETVFDKSAFHGVARCAVPADGWYEWTGRKGRKTAWAIRPREPRLLWFAAICDPWTAPGGQRIWQVATVTCPPSGDVRDIHDRMGVILEPRDLGIWLQGSEPEARRLLHTPPDGMLDVTEARDVDWTGP